MRIALEGIDGAGKTTIARILANRLNIKYLKFPRYDFIPIIKKHISGEIRLDDRTTTLLFLADIIDGINNENNYIADRLFFSTIAYSKLNLDMLVELILELSIPFPEYTIYLDIDLDTALKRVSRKYEITEYDRDIDLLNSVKKRYEIVFSHKEILDRTEVIRIDARLSIEEILELIQNRISKS
ncbi:MAG: hypothetical protein QXV16_01570 [Candidatus Anstonellales archaeon]